MILAVNISVRYGGLDIDLKNKIQFRVLTYIIRSSFLLLFCEIFCQIVISFMLAQYPDQSITNQYFDISQTVWNRKGQLILHYEDLFRIFSFALLLIPYILYLWKMIRKTVTDPLLLITREMSEIGENDLSDRLDVRVDCEFLKLTEEFNHLMNRLEKATKERESMENEKALLLSGMAHDLKTPITTIQGYAQAFKDGVIITDEQKEEYLNAIYIKAKQMNELINVLFEYTRLGTKEYRLNIEEFDLNELVREQIGLFYTDYEEKGIIFQFELPEKPVMIEGDRLQLGRVFSNLLSNGLKYNHKVDKVQVVVKCNEKIEIKIKDTGEIISDEIRNYIFDPFVMGDYARKSGNGNGLGLCIAAKIIALHHGNIRLCEDADSEFRKAFVIVL